jgi:hypothetical protein
MGRCHLLVAANRPQAADGMGHRDHRDHRDHRASGTARDGPMPPMPPMPGAVEGEDAVFGDEEIVWTG